MSSFPMQKHIILNDTYLLVKKIPIETIVLCVLVSDE